MGVCLALEPSDYRGRHLPRARPRPGQGNGSGAARGGDAGARDRRLRGPRRLDERGRSGPRSGRLLRHRRREHRRRHRSGGHGQAQRTGGGGVLRRRRREPGLLPRVPQLRQGARPARGVRLREQLLRRVHPDGAGDRGPGHRRARGRLRRPLAGGRRQRRGGRSRGRPGRGGARTRAATARRCSSARPIATTATRSPIPRSTGPRRRWSAGSSATRWWSRACGSPSSACPTRIWTAAAASAKERMQRASEAALEAPYPDPETDRATEFAG